MTTKLFSKPQTQQVIRDLRKAGYQVEKDPRGMYEANLGTGFNKTTVFAAMPGSRGYLVRFDQRLLTPVAA